MSMTKKDDELPFTYDDYWRNYWLKPTIEGNRTETTGNSEYGASSKFWTDIKRVKELLKELKVIVGYTVSPSFHEAILKECSEYQGELGTIELNGLMIFKVDKQNADCIEWTDKEKMNLYLDMANSQYVTAEMLEGFWIKKEKDNDKS